MSLHEPALPALRVSAPTQFQTLTILAFVLMLLASAWALVDSRLVDGVAVWMKPFKFALSFTVLFGTIALVERSLSQPLREGWPFRLIGWMMTTAFIAEMGYIFYQAARAQPSHFNVATPFDRFMYEIVMAAGAVALVVGVALIGWLVRRDQAASLGEGLRAGIVLGFGLTFGLTMVTAGYLSVNGGHFVGIHPEGGAVLPLFGWSGVTGDLRPAHFVALHAMQVLPLLGLWLDRRGTALAAGKVRMAALGYAGLTVAVFAQAVAGMPLIPIG